jgi:chemotaxis protein MotB
MDTSQTASVGTRVGRLLKVAAAAMMVGVMSIGLGGCNAGGNNLLEANRALQERVTALQAENESLNTTNQQLQAALAARDKALSDLQIQMNSMANSGSGMDDKYRELLERFNSLRFGSLDPETDAALRALAEAHPDLIEYVPELGLLRFKSDVTFASGSDAVNPSARPTLQQLASILNGAASGYDVKIQGHTDSQPVVRARAQHPTNMHLSAHRAISVRNELVNMGVTPQRFEVAGRGEFDPLVANAANGNTPRNRRVEVYLMRAVSRNMNAPSSDSTGGAPAPAAAPSAAPAPREDIMK